MADVRTYCHLRALSGLRVICAANGARYPHMLIWMYVLYCNVLYYTVLCCTVTCCTIRYCTVLHCIVTYCTVLHCTVLQRTVVYYTVLCYTAQCKMSHSLFWSILSLIDWIGWYIIWNQEFDRTVSMALPVFTAMWHSLFLIQLFIYLCYYLFIH